MGVGVGVGVAVGVGVGVGLGVGVGVAVGVGVGVGLGVGVGVADGVGVGVGFFACATVERPSSAVTTIVGTIKKVVLAVPITSFYLIFLRLSALVRNLGCLLTQEVTRT